MSFAGGVGLRKMFGD
jgi:hypothetical protein